MKRKLLVITLLLAVQGCSSTYDEKYNKDNLFTKVTSLQGINDSKQKPFTRYDDAFLGQSVNYTPEKKKILDKEINIDSYSPVDISTILEMIQEQTGITYKLSKNLENKGSDQQNSAVSDDDNYDNDDNYSANNSGDESYPIKFKGKFSDFIRYISTLYDIDLALTNDNILLAKKYQNYAIKLDFYGQDNKYETGLDVGSNEGTSSGGFNGKSETKFTSSFWIDIEKLVTNNVSSGVYTIFKDASILTFTGRHSEYETLKKVISEYQKANSKQFVVSYKIYTLDKSKIKNLNAQMGFSFKDHGTSIGLNNNLIGNITGDISISSDFNGGENAKFLLGAKLDALYELTGKEILQSGTFITRNNVPIPLNMTTSSYFVSGRTQTINAGSDFMDTQIQTEQFTVGTSFIITPRVMSDGNIEIVSGFTKRTLDLLREFGSEDNKVMLPTISSIEMFNTSVMKSGTIAIVSEFDSDEEEDGSKLGVLSAGKESNKSHKTTVMVVGIDFYNSNLSYNE